MSGFIVSLLIGLFIGRELLQAYYGYGSRKPGWFSWMNYTIFFLLILFGLIIAERLVAALTMT